MSFSGRASARLALEYPKRFGERDSLDRRLPSDCAYQTTAEGIALGRERIRAYNAVIRLSHWKENFQRKTYPWMKLQHREWS